MNHSLPRLLLADDEEDIREVLGMALEDQGYEVIAAEDGEAAYAAFCATSPEIVLSDIKMPKMDGVTLLKKIKAKNPETEVIMITGHGDMDLAIQSLKHDATDFVTKPINDDVLEIALKRAWERIDMRRKLRAYTENLEQLVAEQSARLVEIERLAAIGQALEGFSTAVRDMGTDMQGELRSFNEMPCFVAIHNADLKIVFANPRFRQRLGDKVGNPSWSVYRQVGEPSTACPAADTFRTGKGLYIRDIMLDRQGEEVPVMVTTSPIRNSKGGLELVLEIAVDISEVKRLQQELRKLQDRLASLGFMITTVSHGVKGLLTSLDGGMYLLSSGLTAQNPGKITEGYDIVKVMVNRIKDMVLDILYYAKSRELAIERVSVREFVEDLAYSVETGLKDAAVKLVRDFDISLERPDEVFEIDSGVFRSAMVNILENAVDACQADKDQTQHTIVFKVRLKPDHVVFEIIDDGVGMTPETRDNMFTLFFSSKGAQGTGLGLFIAHKIIRQHNGDITVTSTPGQGAHFSIRLPRRRALEAPDDDQA